MDAQEYEDKVKVRSVLSLRDQFLVLEYEFQQLKADFNARLAAVEKPAPPAPEPPEPVKE